MNLHIKPNVCSKKSSYGSSSSSFDGSPSWIALISFTVNMVLPSTSYFDTRISISVSEKFFLKLVICIITTGYHNYGFIENYYKFFYYMLRYISKGFTFWGSLEFLHRSQLHHPQQVSLLLEYQSFYLSQKQSPECYCSLLKESPASISLIWERQQNWKSKIRLFTIMKMTKMENVLESYLKFFSPVLNIFFDLWVGVV